VNLAHFATMDVNMLLSIINMKLRDEFETLDELARFYEIDPNALEQRLKEAGFEYQKSLNQFK
jgi:hypothetical protein